MTDFKLLRHTIKYECEKKNINQKTLCLQLDITEAGFKRMFDKESLKLSTLEQVCYYLKVDLTELLERSKKSQK